MRGVSIIGIGTTPFGILEGKSLKEMATIACNEAIKDSGIEKNAIEAFYLGNFISGILLGQETIAPLVANSLGLPKDIPCTKVEGACCSGGIALRHGYLLIASGLANFVLVAGVEKMSSSTTEKNTEGLASAFDQETEGRTGLTFPGFFALIARRHMYQYGTKVKHLALASDPKLILMDEIFSGLNREEKEDLARFVFRIVLQKRISIVWVEHDMKLIIDLTDRMAYLSYEQIIVEGNPQ